jgi:hypothetical protein
LPCPRQGFRLFEDRAKPEVVVLRIWRFAAEGLHAGHEPLGGGVEEGRLIIQRRDFRNVGKLGSSRHGLLLF